MYGTPREKGEKRIGEGAKKNFFSQVRNVRSWAFPEGKGKKRNRKKKGKNRLGGGKEGGEVHGPLGVPFL